MGDLLRSFTFDRNTLKSNALQSAMEAERHIQLALAGQPLSKTQSNIVGALRSYMGVVDSQGAVTPIGHKFLSLFAQSPEDAWRWLLTRSLWLYSVPNGTRAEVNRHAAALGVSFQFFRTILGVLTHLSALPGDDRFLYYEELCTALDNDMHWKLDAVGLFQLILSNRAASSFRSDRIWLGDLEDAFQIGRDNLNTIFNKAFRQTGLFDYSSGSRGLNGIALSADLDTVFRNRVRFILDHSQLWSGTNWEDHLGLRTTDFPDTLSLKEVEPESVSEEEPEAISGMVEELQNDLARAGLFYDRSLIIRFLSSLLAKRFVILTGLSGSGKTKLAQAFAIWISSKWASGAPTFTAGEIIKADRIDYRVTAADHNSVELESGDEGKRVSLPNGLIDEWVATIQSLGFDRSTSARTMREEVSKNSIYSTQLSSFETHLKALSFSKLEKAASSTSVKHYEVVAVGPDWTSRDACFGYLDALNEQKFVKTTPILDLLMRAVATPDKPFFLVLDEMNLSHVERYFADFLSAAESGELMYVHGGVTTVDGVPPSVPWPPNLFVIGTVNVDETTYMFSPKVLDRANTIEFRVPESEMRAYIDGNSTRVNLAELEARGSRFALSFMSSASAADQSPANWGRLSEELSLLFQILQQSGIEFGFRTAREMARFFAAYETLDASGSEATLLDAQVLQKILPRLSGSRRGLEGTLSAIAVFCAHTRERAGDPLKLINGSELVAAARTAFDLTDPTLHPLSDQYQFAKPALLPKSFEKIVRMLRRLEK